MYSHLLRNARYADTTLTTPSRNPCCPHPTTIAASTSQNQFLRVRFMIIIDTLTATSRRQILYLKIILLQPMPLNHFISSNTIPRYYFLQVSFPLRPLYTNFLYFPLFGHINIRCSDNDKCSADAQYTSLFFSSDLSTFVELQTHAQFESEKARQQECWTLLHTDRRRNLIGKYQKITLFRRITQKK